MASKSTISFTLTSLLLLNGCFSDQTVTYLCKGSHERNDKVTSALSLTVNYDQKNITKASVWSSQTGTTIKMKIYDSEVETYNAGDEYFTFKEEISDTKYGSWAMYFNSDTLTSKVLINQYNNGDKRWRRNQIYNGFCEIRT